MSGTQSIVEVFGNHYLQTRLGKVDELMRLRTSSILAVDEPEFESKAEALEAEISKYDAMGTLGESERLTLLALKYARETGRYEKPDDDLVTVTVEIIETRNKTPMQATVQLKSRPRTKEVFSISDEGLSYQERIDLARTYLSHIGVHSVEDVRTGRRKTNVFEARTVITVTYCLSVRAA